MYIMYSSGLVKKCLNDKKILENAYLYMWTIVPYCHMANMVSQINCLNLGTIPPICSNARMLTGNLKKFYPI